jgi:hypothetical protein
MAKPQHRTPEHRAAYREIKRAQAAGQWLRCVQGEQGSSGSCLMPTRDIAPTDAADVAHDDTGTRVIGAAHARCNRSEAATRGNRLRGAPEDSRWVL